MKQHFIYIFCIVMTLQSCVDRISIPEEKSGSLVLNCEMLYGSSKVVASLTTSNNLNGTEPFINPEDALIIVYGGNNVDGQYRLEYKEESGMYETTQNIEGLWSTLRDYRIKAEVPTDAYESVTANCPVPVRNSVEAVTGGIVTEEIREDGDIYQSRDLEIQIKETNVKPAYFHLMITEKVTSWVIDEDGNRVLSVSEEDAPTLINDVIAGGAGVVNLAHRDGILIDYSRLTDSKLSVNVSSTLPKQTDDQVLAGFEISLHSVTEDYYQYHKAKSNTISATDGTLNEPPIWASNIDNGFGLFSTSTISTQTFEVY